MDPLGFRFDVDGVVVDGWAHRSSCRLLPAPLPGTAVLVPAGAVVLSERCPRACPNCSPQFETLLSFEAASSRSTSDTGGLAGRRWMPSERR